MKYLYLLLALLFSACAYRPVSVVTKDILGENIYVNVEISKTDPQNTVAIKDGIRQAVVTKLNRNLSDEKDATTKINAKILSLSFSELSSDSFGYGTSYKATLVVSYDITYSNGEIQTINSSGDYDFKISQKIKNTDFTDSVISDTERFNAIKNASEQSFDELISNIAIKGVKSGEHSK